MTQSLELRSGAWYGDVPLRLTFPDDWEVEVLGPPELPGLTPSGIRGRVESPVGTASLESLAAGAGSAAVVVDDLTRPTPASRLMPPVLEALDAAGVPRDEVRLFVAVGAHAPATEEQVRRKVGREMARRLEVVPHHCDGPMVELGAGPAGTPIEVNPGLVESDLKIGIGGIYPHTMAGFSGGAKILVPGLCSAATAAHLHRRVGIGHRPGDPQGLDGPFRREAEAIAERIGLEFVVNAVVNSKREIAAVFAGDPVEAHREGVAWFRERHTIDDGHLREGSDILIADAYPFDNTLQFSYAKGLDPLLRASSGDVSLVGLAACPEGLGRHELSPVEESMRERVFRELSELGAARISGLRSRIEGARRLLRRRGMEIHLLSGGIGQDELQGVFPEGRVFSRWEDLLESLEARHPDPGVRVLVYRCAPLLVNRV